MPPVMLPDTNGVILDDFLFSVQASPQFPCSSLESALHNSPSAHVGMVVMSI